MASPQLENGYMRVATELIEALAKIRISGEARQIIDVVMRKTYGFNKKEDHISLSQFCLSTGMRRKNVCRAINKASELNIIFKKATRETTNYSINKDFDSWVPVAKKPRGVAKKRIGSGKKEDKVVAKKPHTIDNNKQYTKDNKPVASKDAPLIVELIDSFKEVNPSYKKWFARPPQRDAASRLIEIHGLETVKKVIKLLPTSNTIPYFPTITTPLELEDRWAKLESAWKRKKQEQDDKNSKFNVAF